MPCLQGCKSLQITRERVVNPKGHGVSLSVNGATGRVRSLYYNARSISSQLTSITRLSSSLSYMRLLPPSIPQMHQLSRTFLMLICCVWMGLGAVHAQSSTSQTYKGTPHEEVQKSLAQRDWNKAMWLIEDYLQNQPRDPQMRFWRARLLEQQNRTDEAFDVYLQLAQDYPELPEVQNNLGVLLAARGKMDEAQQAFEHALRNNPNYATAHENLGDVLLHLAKRSFDKAQALSATSRTLQAKLQALQPALQLTLTKP